MIDLKRLWRHLTTGKASGRRAFPGEVLADIQKTIAEGEQLSSTAYIRAPAHAHCFRITGSGIPKKTAAC